MHEQESIERTQERHIATGRRIAGRICDDSNAADEDRFRSLQPTPRDSAIPEHLLSDDFLHDIDGDVRALHGQVFKGISDELIENYGSNPIWVVVEPEVEDRTTSVLCTDRSLFLIHSSKAWQFFWTTEEAAAEEVGPLVRRHRSTLTARQAAESRDGTFEESLTTNASTARG